MLIKIIFEYLFALKNQQKIPFENGYFNYQFAKLITFFYQLID